MVCVKKMRGKSLWSELRLTLGPDSSPVVSKLSLLPSSFPSSPSLKSPFQSSMPNTNNERRLGTSQHRDNFVYNCSVGGVQGYKFCPSFLFNFAIANERKDDVSKTVPQCSQKFRIWSRFPVMLWKSVWSFTFPGPPQLALVTLLYWGCFTASQFIRVGGRYLSRITPIFFKLSHIMEKQNMYYLTQYKYLKQNIYYLTKSEVEEREKRAQHDWPIEQCLLHIRVFFGTKTKGPCFDLFIHWVMKLTNNEHLPKLFFNVMRKSL